MEHTRVVTGRIRPHPRGFGFLNVTEGDAVLRAFITPPDLNPFLADDEVMATITRAADGRWSASGLTLVRRHRRELFGTVVIRRGGTFIKADPDVANTDWPLDTGGVEVKAGATVLAAVETGRAHLSRVLPADADLSLERVIARYGLHAEFPTDALQEAQAAALRPHVLGARRDLRGVPTITVDAPSTRDIDDAISVLPAGSDGALRVMISIADVAEHVPGGGALDRAARLRATSTYLAGRVLPMFPEELSAGHLSLLPQQDRSCLTVELRLDPEGNVAAVDVYESLIRSWARLNYDEVAEFLDHGRISEAMAPVKEAMPWFRTAGARMGMARARRGGLVISRDEARVTFDRQTGTATGIERVRSNSAHTLVERFMVLANEAIGAWLHDRGVPALYRVHDEPDAERIAEMVEFARHSGFMAGFARKLTPLALAAFDLQIRGAACEPALRSVLRRALGPARYTVHPGGHFGLGAPLYLHFTSPIRRYADLAVHRTIKSYLHGARNFQVEDPAVETLAQHINERAFNASRAESERHRILEAQLMTARVGEEFAAHITRVRPFGFLAQIDETLVEGLVPTDALPAGPYRADDRETLLTNGTRSFTVGMPVRVRLVGTDTQLGRLEFALVGG
ncbi:MAG: RNB domain-containing ribonuclease [Myxococcota bacterium]